MWALRALGHRAATRIYGPELMIRFCARAAASGTPIYLYGGRTPEALELLQQRLRRRFPGLAIAGGYSPPFRELTAAEQQEIARRRSTPAERQVVWVGIGQPKQERWMAMMRPRLQAPLLVGVGAAFDFHAGLVPQAPAWMQRSGLEWAYRLCAGAAPAVASLRPLQPPVRGRLRAPVPRTRRSRAPRAGRR